MLRGFHGPGQKISEAANATQKIRGRRVTHSNNSLLSSIMSFLGGGARSSPSGGINNEKIEMAITEYVYDICFICQTLTLPPDSTL